MFRVIIDEAGKTLRHPARLREVLRLRRWRQFCGILFFQARAGNRWDQFRGQGGLKRREYANYEQYVSHQQSKFKHLDLAEYDRNYRRLLNQRLGALPFPVSGAVLCLGARQGTEVKAFRDLGGFAVGIDLEPGGANPHVLQGDFHALQFPNESVDVIFTNSLDHAFDPERLLGEIKRVLKPEGVLILEAISGDEKGISADHYASFWWRSIDDLIRLIAEHGFELRHRAAFTEPWPGEQLCFRRSGRGN